MKYLFFFLSILLLYSQTSANGVAVADASRGTYLRLVSSHVEATVENQVSITTTTQTFRNDSTLQLKVKYVFPLPDGASATGLRWYVEGTWHTANFASVPQDTSLPGSGGTIAANLKTYLGETPLYFDIVQNVKPDSLLIVELTYVELLPYKNGSVEYFYPEDYHLLQSFVLESQAFAFALNSDRTIDSLQSISHPGVTVANDGHHASFSILRSESHPDTNYRVRYTLRSTELGLFSLSTHTDSGGYFAFIAEPNPSISTDILHKVFTLIIDRSGSMGSENKMAQAKNAATYIVNNLNEGDKFNIVDFSTEVTAFRSGHVFYTSQSRDSALAYISQITWTNLTNISGAFDLAVPQFSAASDSTANIIIFLTDGQPTTGITNVEGILAHVKTLVDSTETLINLFTFGVGSDVNVPLLTLLAAQNNGLSEFLGNNELESRIIDFYTRIRNPVLVNTQMSFSTPSITETYPSPLPNLYKGEQMLVAGRYSSALPATVTFTGSAFGKQVQYQYDLNLSDTANEHYAFLLKVWAKKKIEHLLVVYYSLAPGSAQADSLKKVIIDISVGYGVLSPFTSFTGGPTVGVEEGRAAHNDGNNPSLYALLGNYPNPFNPGTFIRVKLSQGHYEIATVRIYNALGQLIRELHVTVYGGGESEVYWDGKDERGLDAPSGTYVYIVTFEKAVLAGKMLLMK